MNRIVVTGGLGFVGSHIVEHFHRKYPKAQIVILDKLCYPARFEYIQSLWSSGRIELLTGDICDLDLCCEALERADLLIHAAAESHVDNSFLNSDRFVRTNVIGTYTLVEAAMRVGLPLMIHVSTDEVYGECPHADVDETASLAPTNPYSASKGAADLLVLARRKADHLPVMIVRANNMYGFNQFPEKVIPRFICNALTGQKMPIHGTGECRRSFLSAADFAAALDLVATKGTLGNVYNIGSSDEFSVVEIAQMVCDAFSLPFEDACEFVPDRAFNDSRYGIIDERIKALGFRQQRHLTEDFDGLVSWYRDHLPLFMRFLKTGERIGERIMKAAHLAPVDDVPIEIAARQRRRVPEAAVYASR